MYLCFCDHCEDQLLASAATRALLSQQQQLEQLPGRNVRIQLPTRLSHTHPTHLRWEEHRWKNFQDNQAGEGGGDCVFSCLFLHDDTCFGVGVACRVRGGSVTLLYCTCNCESSLSMFMSHCSNMCSGICFINSWLTEDRGVSWVKAWSEGVEPISPCCSCQTWCPQGFYSVIKDSSSELWCHWQLCDYKIWMWWPLDRAPHDSL